MRTHLLAAAAATALACFAAPAFAQCDGDYPLTLNSDGTTSCGSEPIIESNADIAFDIPDEVLDGHEEWLIDQIDIVETDDTYEITLTLEADEYTVATADPAEANHVGQRRTTTTTVTKVGPQTTTTYGGNFQVDFRWGPARVSAGVNGSRTVVGPRTTTTTTTSPQPSQPKPPKPRVRRK